MNNFLALRSHPSLFSVYTPPVTEADVIAHWRKGARDSLHLAKRAEEDGLYELALFHCHLAVEKTLKAAYMEQHRADAPFTHSLLELAQKLDHTWTEEQLIMFDTLTDFVVAARYSDPAWAAEYATAAHTSEWIQNVDSFLPLLGL